MKNGKITDKQIDEFVKACRKVSQYGLVRCSSGNMSYRLGGDLIALSSSGTWLADITSKQVAICKLKDGECINDLVPTVENRFHLGILRERDDINVVLHFQSPYATAICCTEPKNYNFSTIIEMPYYGLDKPAVVEYLPPGSAQLADAVVDSLSNNNIAILRNHGLVTVGKDFDEVIQNACFFELACQILLIQKEPVFLTDKQVEDSKNI